MSLLTAKTAVSKKHHRTHRPVLYFTGIVYAPYAEPTVWTYLLQHSHCVTITTKLDKQHRLVQLKLLIRRTSLVHPNHRVSCRQDQWSLLVDLQPAYNATINYKWDITYKRHSACESCSPSASVNTLSRTRSWIILIKHNNGQCPAHSIISSVAASQTVYTLNASN